MPTDKQSRPRLTTLLAVLLLLQGPMMLLLGLNLLTDQWSFLTSWAKFWTELQAAFRLVVRTPGEFTGNEALFYDVIAFVIIIVAAGAALLAGLTFLRGKAVTWILSLIAQIGALISGIGLFFLHQPPQAYWLLAIGIIMVLYLNYEDVHHWYLTPEQDQEVGVYD